MNNHTNSDFSELILLKKRVADLEMQESQILAKISSRFCIQKCTHISRRIFLGSRLSAKFLALSLRWSKKTVPLLWFPLMARWPMI